MGCGEEEEEKETTLQRDVDSRGVGQRTGGGGTNTGVGWCATARNGTGPFPADASKQLDALARRTRGLAVARVVRYTLWSLSASPVSLCSMHRHVFLAFNRIGMCVLIYQPPTHQTARASPLDGNSVTGMHRWRQRGEQTLGPAATAQAASVASLAGSHTCASRCGKTDSGWSHRTACSQSTL